MLGSPVSIQPCTAATVWSDNFDDGDYVGWNVVEGSFSASNNYLECTHTFSMISHSSTTATGTWSFDIGSTAFNVEFFCVTHGSAGQPYNGYHIGGVDGSGIEFRVVDNGAFTGLAWTPYPSTTPFHVDLTRNSSGYFSIFIDEEYQTGAQDTTHTSPTYFVVHGQSGFIVDNIVVSNTIDITPTTDTGTGTGTDTTPFIPGFPIASIALGVMTAMGTLILIRRRRH
jgi:hypothetical protein